MVDIDTHNVGITHGLTQSHQSGMIHDLIKFSQWINHSGFSIHTFRLVDKLPNLHELINKSDIVEPFLVAWTTLPFSHIQWAGHGPSKSWMMLVNIYGGVP